MGDASYALNHPETEVGQQLAHRLHMPTPRIGLGQKLASMGLATSMMDVSDGLAQAFTSSAKLIVFCIYPGDLYR